MSRSVLVVGGGITGLTVAFDLARAGVAVTVLERESRAGGTATTDRRDGFVVDRGPNGFLTNVPHTLDLARDVGLLDALLPATELAKYRYLYWRDHLEPLPMSPPAMLRSPLLGLGAKLRILGDLVVPARRDAEDESVWDFARRRLGRSFADTFMLPMVSGITAGDARRTSLHGLFPRMVALEQEHGSLLRGMIRMQRSARRALPGPNVDQTAGGPAGPGGRLTSFRDGGVGRLTEALAEQLGQRVVCGIDARSVEVLPDGVRVHSRDGRSWEADRVVIATPAPVAAQLVEDAAPEAAERMRRIECAGVRVTALGWRVQDVPRALDGFGYLVCPGEPHRSLGVLWTSACFPDQAPEGHVLVRVISGGVRDPEHPTLSDERALDLVLADLARSLGVRAAPVFAQQVVWPQAIPQYAVGHPTRVREIRDAVPPGGRVHLAGNSWDGIAMNDCVRTARALAARLAADAGGTVSPAPPS